MNIKDFILGYLIGKNDGGGGASVEPLTVTENGEYSEEGVAYSPVTVNVSGGGGASNIITGTFTPSAAGVASLDTAYTGNGYPIALFITVEGGVYNPDVEDWFNVNRYNNVGTYAMVKSKLTTAPTYSSMDATNNGACMELHKDNNSTFTSYGSSGNAHNYTFKQGDPSATPLGCITIPDKKTIKYYAANKGTEGFATGITYRYWVLYSE